MLSCAQKNDCIAAFLPRPRFPERDDPPVLTRPGAYLANARNTLPAPVTGGAFSALPAQNATSNQTECPESEIR
ncbi:Membrane fusion component of tripartite multidrug resistance system [Cupriavidus basilensis]|uniref:Membrane fusion component of tripartite multidrug resistance system n=1 Tax=Cupriavidus basilensis TaxID=68895 RepID=A0A0C4YF73_9BURK|nr:Membrane fusion component of tripartite multidrug resistance system [Cupriavidus basilensis]